MKRAALSVLALAAVAGCGTTSPLLRTYELNAGQAQQQAGTAAQGDGSVGAAPTAVATGGTGAAVGGDAPGTTGTGGTPGAPAATPATGDGGVPVATAGPGGAGPTTSTGGRSGVRATAAATVSATASAVRTAAAGKPVTTPIKIGVVYGDASSNQAVNSAAGVSAGNSVSIKETVEAYVASYNKHGGLGGRQIQLVEVPESSDSTNFSGDATAACQTLTQDKPVQVVVDVDFGAQYGFDQCITKAGIEDVSVANPPAEADLANRPYEVFTGRMTDDRAYTGALRQLTGTGYLSSKNVLGVIIDKCDDTQTAWNDTVKPAIASLGMKDSVFQTSCIAGEQGLAGASTDMSSAILQFRQAGVDRVMVMSDFDTTYYILFSQAADSQKFLPGYVLTSNAEGIELESNVPADQKTNLHGAGHIPTYDTDGASKTPTVVEKTCLAAAAEGGVTPAATADYVLLFNLCQPFQVLQAALSHDGGSSAPATLSQAITGLGTSLPLAGINGGAADFRRLDVPLQEQVFGYDTGCSCLKYSGSPAPV